MDIPYDRPFGGYGVGVEAPPASPGSYADEVRARIKQIHAPGATGAPTPPPLAAGTANAGAFYNRPIPVPSWLKTAGGFGAKVLRAGGVVGGIAAASEYGGRALEFGANAAANAYAAGGSDMRPNPAVQAAQPAAPLPAPAAEPLPTGPDQVSMGAANLRTAMSPAFANPATPENTAVPARGTGFIQNNQTGATTYIDSRRAAAPASVDYTGGNPAAAFFQAGARIKQISGDNAQNLAGAKLMLDTAVKGAEAGKHTAEARNLGIRGVLAERLAEQGDFAGAAAASGGRAAPARSVLEPSMNPDPASPRIVMDARTGKIQQKIAPPANIEEHIKADMAAKKLTRAQALQAYKDKGYDVSGMK